MSKLRKVNYRTDAKKASNGVTSFYGVHPYTTVKMSPRLSIQAPVNSLYGPHLVFGNEAKAEGANEESEQEQ